MKNYFIFLEGFERPRGDNTSLKDNMESGLAGRILPSYNVDYKTKKELASDSFRKNF